MKTMRKRIAFVLALMMCVALALPGMTASAENIGTYPVGQEMGWIEFYSSPLPIESCILSSGYLPNGVQVIAEDNGVYITGIPETTGSFVAEYIVMTSEAVNSAYVSFTVANSPTPAPASQGIVVTKSPTGEHVEAGGSAKFVARANNAERIVWRLVSHDTTAVVNLCDRAVLLENSQVKMIGSPKEVSEQYLKDLYSDNQDVEGNQYEQPQQAEQPEGEYYDMRRAMINGSKYRNDMEVFKFSNQSCFGAGGAEIENVFFADLEGKPLSWIVGGEIVKLTIAVRVHTDMSSPIVGFTVKDRLGQWILGDNTYITYQNAPVRAAAGQKLVAEFEFYMPTLQPGNYSIDCAVADGTQENHVQQQWLHDAVVFVSHSSYTFSLFGAVMKKIDLRIQ